MREAICGFYGGQYVSDLLVLALFLVLFMALGLLIRPLMANVNRMVARQVRDGGLFNGEDVGHPRAPLPHLPDHAGRSPTRTPTPRPCSSAMRRSTAGTRGS